MWLECGISQVVVLVGGWMDAHKTSHVVRMAARTWFSWHVQRHK
jgi:hypothetical protein